MLGVYHPLLAFLSLVVAALASYTTFELSARIFALRHRGRRGPWLAGGAMAMGVGIWSTHFLGMMAFTLPIPVGYAIGPTLYSVLLSCATSALALHALTSGVGTWPRTIASGVLMGLGIVGMHYVGMAALPLSPAIQYHVPTVLLSFGVAIVSSIAALRMAFHLRGDDDPRALAKRFGAALMMAVAICGMHYIGMMAARFAPDSVCLAVAREIDKDWLAVMVAAASFLATVGTLMFLSWHASTLAGSLRRANRQLVHLGTHDALTGLPNRLLLAQSVDDAIEQATHDDAAFALFFIDLDGFKAINDSIGHAAGDELLKVCATRLTQRLRKTDVVARLGGDEFVVVSNHLRDIAVVDAIAAGLLLALSEEAVIRGAPLRVSASIGVATYPRDGGTTQALLHAADVAMYEAKQGGRNAWRRFDHAMLANAHRMLRLQIDLAAAVGQGQLAVDFQPKFSVRDRAMTGAEALLRWHHPEFGVIAPMEFIPLAERSGQIGEIGDWVLREVCRELTGWHAEGLAPLTISINLSAAQFNAPDLVDRICAIVAAERVSPRCLVFEITETVAMQNGERAAATIGRLRENGLETVIADFGAGYTSLAYLRRFQVRQIKVDPFFVHQLDHHGHEGQALLEAIITLSHALNMEVVAEGVETAAQLDSLASLHCDEVQGFQVSRPLATALFRQCRLALNAKNAGSGLGAAPWYDDLGTLFNQGEPREPMTQ